MNIEIEIECEETHGVVHVVRYYRFLSWFKKGESGSYQREKAITGCTYDCHHRNLVHTSRLKNLKNETHWHLRKISSKNAGDIVGSV